jgi:hypothetical protein
MADIPPVKPVSSERTFSSIEISTGATGLSAAHAIGGCALSSIVMSTTWTAASLTLQASLDGTNYFDVYDEFGNEVTITTTGNRVVQLDPAKFAAFTHVKLRSGTGSAAVAQAATRTLKLGLVPV